ncbi:MAG TPA: type II CAAX endopeptidase family protein [Bradyrhizobium sp.]
MDSLDPANPPVTVVPEDYAPRAWGFWGTVLWGLVVFAAMFVGQIAVVFFFALERGGGLDHAAMIRAVASNGSAISLSVIAGLPAVLLALWLAIRWTHMSFADYLALRWTSWRNVVLGIVGLAALVASWDLLSRAIGKDVSPDFMIDVFKSARADDALWLLVLAFCAAAPITEELFARGFLYRGLSESFLGVAGAILVSSIVWTSLHLQYDWFFFGEVFCIGLWFGYIRYRSQSTWLTIVLHALNNLAAVVQSYLLAG